MPKFMAEHKDFLLTLCNLNYGEGKDALHTEDESSENVY